jgi:hypothetical protein
MAQQRGLADTGLARDEHEPPTRAPRGVVGGVERIQLGGALEERCGSNRGGECHRAHSLPPETLWHP